MPLKKKKRLYHSISSNHYFSQDVNPDFLNICAAPPTATLDINIGLLIINIFNINAVESYAVYVLYFRLNDLC